MPVLSIQSHVVYGHAGNSAAVFPLQRLGHEVWAINTVEFSNHTGYKAWRGEALSPALVESLVLGLEERDVLKHCNAVLSGYLGDPASGRAIISAVKKIRSHAPGALYCCDPVMGDVGRGFYVKPEIPDVFKNEVIPLADIVTPNQFELNALTGMNAETLEDVLEGVKRLHAAGPRIILVTSLKTKEMEVSDSPEIGMLVSDGKNAYRISTPELYFENSTSMAGSGDLTTSVFLSGYLETGDIQRALELTAASVYGIMEATHREKSRELLIIAAQDELKTSTFSFRAVKV
ncbi:MAG: pyridoxal kinase PdxY [Spirochaetaceae bacterium]|jgi:pyridoxine kinase|nr:pyridoxal kinase PdxY [Spirochaetaceae bacterium]